MTSVLNDQETSILLALKAKADAGSPTGAIEVTPEQTEIMRKAYLAVMLGGVEIPEHIKKTAEKLFN